IFVADSIAEIAFDGVAKTRMRGTYDVIGGVPRFVRGGGGGGAGRGGAGRGAGGRGAGGQAQAAAPVLLAHHSALAQLRSSQSIDIRLRSESFEAPSVNIIGMVRGTDPKLRDEYVLFSSHQDHDGVRYVVDGDSTWSGADDNASTSVAL